ncbi:hybrid sensor histidine kinase/response regulator [Candidatus Magnetobacterium casense]|uniref:histidine kinase n=1 Tax=Candidatus Magnetobacterium casense TaxID=1455061 RepID=A0ABS6S137_9BACT|nr:hybrid sensor histidine kinase/response regulator [Candidatus Magnetobacterium casensis]MBV6342310.1 hybrid sensor histidine kinase/response regulator [Candidatus Magnetobacterium casensis]
MISSDNEPSGSKVLIVDDMYDNLQILGNVLSARGMDVSVATNGEQAIEIVSYDKIDLILLDISMPVMNGYEVCEILKSNPKTSHIPVIFLTAKTQSADIVKGFEVGAVDYITKPFNTAELMARVNTHLEITKARQRQEQVLIQQSKMAAMGEMIGVIAHQLKQPLNRLSLIVQNIAFDHMDGKIDDTYLKDLEQELLNTVFFMSTTINDFRDFFSPHKRQETFDVKVAIGCALSMLGNQFSRDGISYRLTCHLHGDTFTSHTEITPCESMSVTACKNEFIHAALNIINNAKDAVLQRRKTRSLTGHHREDIRIDLLRESDTISIQIQDTGGGVPQEMLTMIFDYGVTSKADAGTGIGLYIAKVIIEKNIGGRLSVENRDEGAVFTIELRQSTE